MTDQRIQRVALIWWGQEGQDEEEEEVEEEEEEAEVQ